MIAKNKSIVISYMKLRTLIGILGLALPVMCYAWCCFFNGGVVLDSLSMHYYTNFRDIFVGILIAVSVFLITYQGYTSVDNIVTVVIGLSAMGIAFFPCENDAYTAKVSFLQLTNSVTNIVHCFSAILFFGLLAVNSFFLFTRSDKPVAAKSRKYYRNIIYRVCGVIIAIGLVAMIILSFFADQEFKDRTHALLLVETLMLTAFSISWLVKGGAILRDIQQ